MLNLYQLQMFLAVVDSGSFSAAAAHLHVTQPAVSEGVRALEQRLGARLFDRRGHRAAVTPEGAALIPTARGLLDLAEQTEQRLLSQKGSVAGNLRLATATTAAAPALAARLAGFLQAHREVQAALIALEPAAVLDSLRSGESDIGLLAERPRGGKLLAAAVATDEWVLLVPPAHPWLTGLRDTGAEANPAVPVAPLKRKRGRPRSHPPPAAPAGPLPTVPAAALATQPLVVEGRTSILGAETSRELRDLLDERGVVWSSLRPVLELLGPAAILSAVESGAGVAFLPLSQLHNYQGPALALRLDGKPMLRHLVAVRDARVAGTLTTVSAWEALTGRSTGESAPL